MFASSLSYGCRSVKQIGLWAYILCEVLLGFFKVHQGFMSAWCRYRYPMSSNREWWMAMILSLKYS